MGGAYKRVDHVPLDAEEQLILDGERACFAKSKFISEYAKRIGAGMGIKVQEAEIMASVLLDMFQQLVTKTSYLHVPYMGTFKRMDDLNVRFYPDPVLRTKYLVTTDNGEEGYNVKMHRMKKELDEVHKKII